jgi:hypothetical protein
MGQEQGKVHFAGYLVRIKLNSLANPYFVCAFLNLEYGKKMLFNHTQVI